jgi:cyanophycinase
MLGMLMPIGGAEDRRAQRIILKHFVHLCGGSNAHIAVIPSASRMSKGLAAEYESIFLRLGANQIQTIDIINRHQANDQQMVKQLNDVTGIFFTGGDQMRLLSLIGDTRFADRLATRFRQGVHIGGTSAGASAMSRHMISSGKSGLSTSAHMVQMATGLGLAHSLIIDQHFSQRNRIGRLMSAVMLHPKMLGIGLDEDTSLTIASNGKCRIIGSGTVTLVMDTHLNPTSQFTTYNNQLPVSDRLVVSQLKTGEEVVLPYL